MSAHRVDLELASELKRYGAFDADACFNCGNCTAICQHAAESDGFPRRLIRYGQLGMREKLLSAKETWLCWNCRDCSESCPRQARPGEFMEAARRYTIASMDPTGISRWMYNSTLFLVAFAIGLAALFAGVLLSGSEAAAAGRLDLFGFIPFHLIHDIGVAVMAMVGLLALISTGRLVRHLSRVMVPADQEMDPAPAGGSLGARLFAATRDVLTEMAAHRRFRDCDLDKGQPAYQQPWFVHYSMMWGFIGLALATALDFLFKVPGSEVPLWYPTRMLGTVAGLFLMYGASVTIARWLRPAERVDSRRRASDWLFLGLLFLVGLTGFILEILIYLPSVGSAGYAVFLVHVVLAMELLVLLPFTKFAHAIYRPLAYGIFRFRAARHRAPGMGEVLQRVP